jgi:hypothetical protein
MTNYKEFSVGNKGNTFGSFGPLIGLIIFVAVLYFLVKGVFSILSILAPFLLIGAAILDYTVITDFIKFIVKLMKENPIMGLIAIFLGIMGFPVLFGFLFFKAYMRRNFKKIETKVKQEQTRFDDYEEVKETNKTNTEDPNDFLILPNISKPQEVKKESSSPKNDYENLF